MVGPLYFACENGKIEVVEYLMKHGAQAQIDMQDKVNIVIDDTWLRMKLLYEYDISMVQPHFIMHVKILRLRWWNG